MKNLLLFIVILGFTSNFYGQNEDIDINELKTPTSPGFQILDLSPSNIERPTNPKSFALSLMTLTNNGNAIPKNFAMEVSPYWFFKFENESVYKYLSINPKDQKATYDFSGILRKLSVSMASTYNDSASSTLQKNTNYIAIGIRTNLLTIRTSKQNNNLKTGLRIFSNRVDTLRTHKKELDILYQQRRLKFKDKSEKFKKYSDAIKEGKDTETATNEYENAEIEYNQIVNKINSIDDMLPNELKEKVENDKEAQNALKKLDELPLLQIDAALAYSEAIPDNEYKNKRFNRSGFWLNTSLNLFSDGENKNELEDHLSLIVSMKLISDNLLDTTNTIDYKRNSAFDYGGKIEYAIKNFSIGIEYLKRNYSDNSDLNSERTVGVLQYKISDGVYFTGSYGKNFGDVKNLFTLFGINYGFGKSKLNTNKK